MKKYFDMLGLTEEASARTIVHRYHVLAHIHHPTNGGAPETFLRIKHAFSCLIGAKHEIEQFNTLLSLMANIVSTNNLYLRYDKDPLLPGQQVAVFNLSYYAHGEIIKLCQHLVWVFEQHRVAKNAATIIDSLPNDAILTCVNKVLSTLQRVYQFDHHDINSADGIHYYAVLQKINTLFQAVRPELSNDNAVLFRMIPHKTEQDPEPRPSILPPILDDFQSFLLRITQEPINERINESSQLIKRVKSETTENDEAKEDSPSSLTRIKLGFFEKECHFHNDEDTLSELSNDSVL
jgi:hypothetical protein